MAAMMCGIFAIFSQKPILLFFAPVLERPFAWEGLLLRHPWSLGKQRSAEIPMFKRKDTHLHELLTLQPIWQFLPWEAASHPPPPQSTDSRSHQTEPQGLLKGLQYNLTLQLWHLLPGRQPRTYKAQGCITNSAENKCAPWVTLRYTMCYRNLTAGNTGKKKLFTKVLHHGHIFHCW